MVYFDDSQARAASMAGVLRDLGWDVQVAHTPRGTTVDAHPHLRTYGEQKKAAQRWAAANEIPVIYVCD
jgi:hypothetical protein